MKTRTEWLFEVPLISEATSDFEIPVHPDIAEHCSTATRIVKDLSPYVGKRLQGREQQEKEQIAFRAKAAIDSMAARVKNNLTRYSIRDLDVLLGCFGRVDHVFRGVGSKIPAPLINLRAVAANQINILKGRNSEDQMAVLNSSKPSNKQQWLFESPYVDQELEPEADAMFDWAKKKWEEWKKGKLATPAQGQKSKRNRQVIEREIREARKNLELQKISYESQNCYERIYNPKEQNLDLQKKCLDLKASMERLKGRISNLEAELKSL